MIGFVENYYERPSTLSQDPRNCNVLCWWVLKLKMDSAGFDCGITRRSQIVVPIHLPLWTVLKPKWYDYYTFSSQRERFIFRSKVAGRLTIKVMIYISGPKSTKDAIIDTIRISGFCWYYFWPCTRLRWQNWLFRSLPKTELEKVENLEKSWESSQHSQPLNCVSQGLEFLKVSVKTHV